MTKQIGIAGAPGGATHYAARLFGLPHENESWLENVGLVDYLLAVPADQWPRPGRLPRDYPPVAYVTMVDFEHRYTVIRRPINVVATNLGQRDPHFLRELGAIVGVEPRMPEELANFATRVILAWYDMCLDWSDGAYLLAEDDAQKHKYKVPYDGPVYVPAPCERGHKIGPRPPIEHIYNQLTNRVSQDLVNFEMRYYYATP